MEHEDYEASYYLGKALFNLREFNLALSYFENSFKGHPAELKKYKYAYSFTELYKNGLENYVNRKLNTALSFGKKLEELKGDWWFKGILLNFLIYYKLGDLNTAELYLQQALNLSPNDLKLNARLTSLRFEQKNYNKAIEACIKTIKLRKKSDSEPNYLKALLILGLSHANLKNDSEARKIFTEILRIDPENKFAKKAFSSLIKIN